MQKRRQQLLQSLQLALSTACWVLSNSRQDTHEKIDSLNVSDFCSWYRATLCSSALTPPTLGITSRTSCWPSWWVQLLKSSRYIILSVIRMFLYFTLTKLNGIQEKCFCTFTQVSAVISIPLWHWFLQRFGKKTAAFCGITVSIMFVFWFVRGVLHFLYNENHVLLTCPFGSLYVQ